MGSYLQTGTRLRDRRARGEAARLGTIVKVERSLLYGNSNHLVTVRWDDGAQERKVPNGFAWEIVQ